MNRNKGEGGSHDGDLHQLSGSAHHAPMSRRQVGQEGART